MRISRTFITKSVLQIFFFNQNAIWIQNHATDAGYVAQASITIQVIKKQSQQEESFLKNWRKINIENQQNAKASNENVDDDSGSSWVQVLQKPWVIIVTQTTNPKVESNLVYLNFESISISNLHRGRKLNTKK